MSSYELMFEFVLSSLSCLTSSSKLTYGSLLFFYASQPLCMEIKEDTVRDHNNQNNVSLCKVTIICMNYSLYQMVCLCYFLQYIWQWLDLLLDNYTIITKPISRLVLCVIIVHHVKNDLSICIRIRPKDLIPIIPLVVLQCLHLSLNLAIFWFCFQLRYHYHKNINGRRK